MDDVDLTTERMLNESAHLIQASKKPAGPEPCGDCYYCGEPVKAEARWCDDDCAHAWEYEQKRLKIAGQT